MNDYDDDFLLNKLDNLIQKNKTIFSDNELKDKDIIKDVFEHLSKDNIVCILLRGSLANNRYNQNSDADVVVIVKKVEKTELSFHNDKGLRYHFNIFDETFLMPNKDKHLYRFYYGMRKIYDPYNVCDKLINDIKEYEIYNCNKIIKQNPEGKDYLYRLLEYVDGGNELLSIFVKAKILRESPAFLSNYNGFNLIGFKTTIDCLIRDNYNLALIYAKALDKKSGKKELKEWLDAAFNGLCGINVLNQDFSSSKKSYEILVNGTSMYDLYNDYYNFIDYLNICNIYNIQTYKFFIECKDEAPKFFNKILDFIS